MSGLYEIKWKRVYENVEKDDGFRVLVDRLWPRGLKKEKAKIDYWAKIIAPTNELRKSYHEGRMDFKTFSINYKKELKQNPEFRKFLEIISGELKNKNITMVYASKIPELSHIPILKEEIENKVKDI